MESASNKISRPDFIQAEKAISEDVRRQTARRLGQRAMRRVFHSPEYSRRSQNSPASSENRLKINVSDGPALEAKSTDFGLSDLFDETDFTGDTATDAELAESTEAIEESNARLNIAKEAMQKAIAENFVSSMREHHRLSNALSDTQLMLDLATTETRRRNPGNISTRSQITDHLRDQIDQIREKKTSLEDSSPEGFVVVNGLELRKHIREIRQGEIVSTPYVAEHLARVEHNMAEGRPTFIHGHLGSGKTELAIMAAKHSSIAAAARAESLSELQTYSKEHPEASKADKRKKLGQSYRQNLAEFQNALRNGDRVATERFSPLVISGSKDLTSQDLYMDKTLTLTQVNAKTVAEHTAEVDRLYQEWRKSHQDASAEEQSRAATTILETYTMGHQAFGTEVETIKQAIYRGVEEGRPVIIDEVNAIPTAVLISMNDILQRRPGQNAFIPGAGPVKIKEGFSITMTGNLSSNTVNYGGTEDLNPAFLSRLDVIEHDYLPMSESDPSYNAQYDPKRNELFQVVIAYLADEQGNLELPEMENSLEKLFALAQLAKKSQRIFGGKWSESDMLKTNSGDDFEPQLETSVLSIRNLLNVLKEWDKGSEKDLDKALWDGYISNIVDADEQNLTLALAKQFGFFQNSDGWKVDVKERGAGFASLSEIHPDPFRHIRKPVETYDFRRTVQAVYGEGPEREVYPDDISLTELELDESPLTPEDIFAAEKVRDEVALAIKAAEVLYSQCGCDAKESNS